MKLKDEINNDSRDVTKQPGRMFCWVSGITRRPKFWHAPWFLQAAHLGSGSGSMYRLDDRRAVICLCPMLHQLHVADRKKVNSLSMGGRKWPTIDNANTIWIKSVWDPEYYDPDFIEKAWIGKPPVPEPPDEFWLKMINDSVGMRVPSRG